MLNKKQSYGKQNFVDFRYLSEKEKQKQSDRITEFNRVVWH